MSLDVAARLKTYLASAPQTQHRIPTLQIGHSLMTRHYFLWREPYVGTITTEGGSVTVEPANFKEDLAGAEGHLDQVINISLDTTHIDDAFREELDRIPLDTTEKVLVIYREYLSDDLASIVAGPVTVQVESTSFQRGAAAITAVLPRLNVTRTGEIYAPRDVPMLRGFL